MADPQGIEVRRAEQRRLSGFWQNPEWSLDEPGTFAVVVGVSRYPHMAAQGPNPRAGLTEGLYVSASTAFEFHRWLRSPDNGFAWPAAPLARTWLLLAPTDAERQHDPELDAATFGEPTFERLEQALSDWYYSMKSLPAHAAKGSCGVLFFSGHGVSYGAEGQLLLPSDWPDPLRANPDNWAPQTQFLLKGTSVLAVRDFLFFIDACWNSGGSMVGGFKADGTPILPLPADSDLKTRNQRQAVIFAAAQGRQTMQPSDPAMGISVFGEALMASLRTPGGTLADPGHTRNGLQPVRFASLVPDVSSRVQTLLTEKVRIVDDESPVSDGGNGISFAYATWRPEVAQETDPPQQVRVPPPAPAEQAYTRHEEATWRSDGEYPALHNLVHHESIAWPLIGLRLYRMNGEGERLSAAVTVERVRRNDDASLVRYDLTLDPVAADDPVWMVLADPTQPQTAWATTLPLGAATYTVSYREVSQDRRPPSVKFAFAVQNAGVLGQVAATWTQLRERPDSDPLAAVDHVALVAEALRNDADRTTVVAAELLASMRLPNGAGGVATDHLRQLWQAHRSADCAVLYANRLIEEGGHDREEIDGILATLSDLGLPTINAVAELLDAIALRRRHRGEPLPIERWLSAAGRVRYRGRMLTCYTGSIGRLGPWLARPDTWQALSGYATDLYRPPTTSLSPTTEVSGVRLPVRVADDDHSAGIATYQALAFEADTAGTVTGREEIDLAARLHVPVQTIRNGIEYLVLLGQLTVSGVAGAGTVVYQLADPSPPLPSPRWWAGSRADDKFVG